MLIPAGFNSLHVILNILHLLLGCNNEDDKKKDASKSYV